MRKLFSKIAAFALAAVACFGASACQKDTLVVYTEAGFAPFEYVSGRKIVGVDIDIMNKVGKKLGKRVVFEDVPFDTIVDAVAEGKLTNVGAAGISITPERQEKVAFSNEYYTANLYVIYKTADAETYESTTTDGVKGVYWDNMVGKKIAIQSGTTADLFLGDELDSGVFKDTNTARVAFDSLATAVADLNLESDVLIIDELPAKSLIAGKSDLTCAPLYYKGGDGENDEAAVDTYAICVTKGQTELLNAINEVLAELGEAGIQALVNQHLGLD